MDWILNTLDWLGLFKFWDMMFTPLGALYLMFSVHFANRCSEAEGKLKNRI